MIYQDQVNKNIGEYVTEQVNKYGKKLHTTTQRKYTYYASHAKSKKKPSVH